MTSIATGLRLLPELLPSLEAMETYRSRFSHKMVPAMAALG
jgi:hypothetical protein